MEALTPWHLLLILVAFVLLVGYRKLPDAARSVGRSLRIFRGEMRALDGEAPPAVPQSPTGQPTTGATPDPAVQTPAVSAEDLEREAAGAEELAAQLRARAAALPADRPVVS